ncbi:MAG: glycoside hydrolase family 127 protein [Chitinophagaceae bacterium]
MNKCKAALSVVLFFIQFIVCNAQNDIAISPAKPVAVQLFSLHNVRLLDSYFKHIEDLDHDYLLKLEPDKLASWFRREAGLTPKAPPYPSWESENVTPTSALPGHIMGFYLSAMSMMYASTDDEAIKQKLIYTLNELQECQVANGNGYLLPTVGGKHVFEDVVAGNFKTENPTINDVFEPTYVMNKIMLGLYSVYTQCNLPLAKEIDVKMADWFGSQVIDKLSHEQMQKLLFCEHGSLNESFVQVYRITGDKKYLEWAKRLTDEMLFIPLSKNDDMLTGQHANTQIPKFTGYENVYDYTGDKSYNDAAINFWTTVTTNRTWINGGNSMNEHFFPPQDFEKNLPMRGGPESCNSINMMRLTERLYQDMPSPAMLAYYENVLFNHILANYNPETGQAVYYTSMRPGSYKIYGVPLKSFWCCSGTGLEAPAKFGQMIYAHDTGSLYVNLFISSQLSWPEKGLSMTQQTSIPDNDNTTLTLHLKQSEKFSLLIRKPDWLAGAIKVSVNGKTQSYTLSTPGFIAINRSWKDGDVIKAILPMKLEIKSLPYSDKYVSFSYGPVLLASKTDNHGLTNDDFNQVNTTVQNKLIPVTDAQSVIGKMQDLSAQFKRVQNKSIRFTNTKNGIELIPYNEIHFDRYTIYYRRYDNQAALETVKDSLLKEENNATAIDKKTVDRVIVADSSSEKVHQMQAVSSGSSVANGWRDANNGGYFMYDLKLPDNGTPKLYIVFSASDDGDRIFDILIDGKLLKTFDHTKPAEGKSSLYPEVIPLPIEMIKDKKSITVKFSAHNHKMAGGVFDVRIIN